jgi:hypothetical protein
LSRDVAARGRAGSRAGAGANAASRDAARACSAAEVAWIAALPVAVLVVGAIVVLGPPLGRLLFGPSATSFWRDSLFVVKPEPTEQARFLIALTAPLLLAGAVLLAERRPLRLSAAAAGRAVWAAQAAGVAFVVACLAIQRHVTYESLFASGGPPFHRAYFTNATLLVAVAAAAALLAGVRDARVRTRFAAWARESRGRRIGATAVAALLVAVWELHAFTTEGTVAREHFAAMYHIQFTMDETAAVLDGRSPLVNFAAQYGSLWPYPVAAAMALVGKSIGSFSALMCLISGIAMLAIYGVLRRVARSAVAGLLLFAPFLATSFFLLRGPLDARYTFGNIYSDYPIRFAGPWLLAWLTARHLGGERPRGRWVLFLVAGLVALNNVDHGIPALGAALAALLWTEGRPTRAGLLALARDVAAGVAAAIALVSLGLLVRSGSLPDFALGVRYARLFAVAGYEMLPMPTLGFHTVIYLTFVAAIVVATVRAVAGESDRLLTGMLAFSGIFGLGAGAYFVGRSHPEVLVASFGAWALAVALLLVAALRRYATQRSRWPAPALAACAVAFCVCAVSLAQTPGPWEQLRRLDRTGARILHAPAGQQLVAATAHRGERVALLFLLGHWIGANLGVTDVTPYTGGISMPARQQLTDTIRALRDEGGSKLYLDSTVHPEMGEALGAAGFVLTRRDRQGLELWVDHGRAGG